MRKSFDTGRSARQLAGGLLMVLCSVAAADSSSASYRVSGAVMFDHSAAPQDAAGPSYRVFSRSASAFHGVATAAGHFRLESGHPPFVLPAVSPDAGLQLTRLTGAAGSLTATFSATGLPAGTSFTLSCTSVSDGSTHAVSGTQSPLLLDGLETGTRYGCTLSGGGLTTAAIYAVAGPHAIPGLSTWGSVLLALLLAITARGRRLRRAWGLLRCSYGVKRKLPETASELHVGAGSGTHTNAWLDHAQ